MRLRFSIDAMGAKRGEHANAVDSVPFYASRAMRRDEKD